MALYRTALRLATIEGLRPAALLNARGPWPTLAEERVFDSRLDPLEDLTRDQHKAVIVVYTEGDQGYGGQHTGGPPFKREVDLIFEISQIAAIDSEADPNAYVAGVPQTDGELEAELDRIESEIAFALFFAPEGQIWRDLTGSNVSDPRSHPERTTEERARLAMRCVTWKVMVPDDLYVTALDQEMQDVDRLPDPLRSVIKRLDHSDYARKLGIGLGRTMPLLPAPGPFHGISLGVEVVKSGADRTGTANLSGDVTLPPES